MLNILWILINYGITNALVNSNLFDKFKLRLRNSKSKYPHFLFKMLICMMCTGFWVGGFLGIVYNSPTGFILWDAFLGSGTAWILHALVWKLMLKEGKH